MCTLCAACVCVNNCVNNWTSEPVYVCRRRERGPNLLVGLSSLKAVGPPKVTQDDNCVKMIANIIQTLFECAQGETLVALDELRCRASEASRSPALWFVFFRIQKPFIAFECSQKCVPQVKRRSASPIFCSRVLHTLFPLLKQLFLFSFVCTACTGLYIWPPLNSRMWREAGMPRVAACGRYHGSQWEIWEMIEKKNMKQASPAHYSLGCIIHKRYHKQLLLSYAKALDIDWPH